MKKIIFSAMLLIVTSIAHAGNGDKETKDKKTMKAPSFGLTAVKGVISVVKIDTKVTAVRCNAPYDLVCIWVASVSGPDAMPTCAVTTWTDQYTYNLDQNNTYLGFPIDGGINFYQVDYVNVSCIEDGVLVDFSPEITIPDE